MASSDAPVVICLIGITGEGKSSTGNMLCQDATAFKTSRGMRSMTSTCAFKDWESSGVFYRVIDTPGLQDTNLSPEELHARLRVFADLSPHGVDAFLFVMKRGRFRPEYEVALKAFEEACTPEALKHTIFVFTCLEDEEDVEFKKSLSSEDIPSLSVCLEKVNGRVVGVENKFGGRERQLADQGLVLSCVNDLRDKCKVPYSNHHLQDADRWRMTIQTKIQELELGANQETVSQLLRDLFHGRCQRSEVQSKLSALMRSEARFKAKDVVDAMALMGQVKEVSERLSFESNQLPDCCGKEICIDIQRFCSKHRECNREGYFCQGSNHPSNCTLFPRYTHRGQTAARQNCTSTWVRNQKQRILDEVQILQTNACKEFLQEQLQRLTPAVVFRNFAADIRARHDSIQAACATLASCCQETLTFHIVVGYQRDCHERCGNRFHTESARIAAANGRIAEFAKSLEALAHASQKTAACVIQAVFRGRAARVAAAHLRATVAKEQSRMERTLKEFTNEEAAAIIGEINAVGGDNQNLLHPKRPTRRGGMNKRLQEVRNLDTSSIPPTDDGFD